MEPSWLTLLIQVPLVGVFIWYSLEMNKRSAEAQKSYMDALDRRDQEYEKRNLALITSINAMSMAITKSVDNLATCQNEHDDFVRENVARRESATKRGGKVQ